MQNNLLKIPSFIFCLCLASCSLSDAKLYRDTRIAMYTSTAISVVADSKEIATKAFDAAFAELNRLEKLLNYYDNASEVALINKHAGIKPVKVSAETFELIEMALFVSRHTGGAFDITTGRLIKLWDFKNKKIPEAKDIANALTLCGWQRVILNKEAQTVFLSKKGMEINLGGIIKGYSAGKAVEVLKKNGIKAGLVSVAGDISAFGLRPDGQMWNVGVRDPRPKNLKDDIFASVKISNESISTSGDYERFFEFDGKRYHHIINPSTGYPSQHCRSVTVVENVPAYADAFATAFCVLDYQSALKIADKLGFGALIIAPDNSVHMTDNLKQRVILR